MPSTLSASQNRSFPSAGRYMPPLEVYDEWMLPTGGMRGPWQVFMEHVQRVGTNEVQRRWMGAQARLAQDGVHFDPHGAKESNYRPWILDAMPFILDAAQWSSLESGLQQRARLWDRLLQDLLGRQQVLRDRVLPAELFYGHPHYQPEWEGLQPAEHCRLTISAVELARTPQGIWTAVGDRTGSHLGLGYTLENRITARHMWPEPLHELQVQRLAPFFVALQQTLESLSPRAEKHPCIVLWSQNSDRHASFEDAYLARYLGYPLVQGDDLAVRNRQLVIKTLEGPIAVDVAWRRIPDEDVDPVELNPGVRDGVAGLLTAVRDGRVRLVNVLGARMLESPAFLAYLPDVCRYYLSEEPRIPNVRTWWCGDAAAMQAGLNELDHCLVRPAFRGSGSSPVVPRNLSSSARQELLIRIHSTPGKYVIQELIDRSVTPVWRESGVEPWRLGLRTFALHTADAYPILPGGLARVARTSIDLDQTFIAGESSQDVWILSDQPVEPVSLLPATDRTLEIRRAGLELSSRIADHFFWLGRQSDRAEFACRVLREVLRHSFSHPAFNSVLPNLLRYLAETGQIEPGYVVRDLSDNLPELATILPAAILDRDNSQSLSSIVDQMSHLASVVRDRLSPDACRIIRQMDEICHPPVDELVRSASELSEMIERMMVAWSAWAGLISDGMTRTHAWRFLQLGRRLERALQTLTLLNLMMVVGSSDERSTLETTLSILDCPMTYRTRYHAEFQMAAVLDLLLLDESNPRSVCHQLANIQDDVQHLPVLHDPQRPAWVRPSVAELLNGVRQWEIYRLAEYQPGGERQSLRQHLTNLAINLQQFARQLTQTYLVHTVPYQQLAER